MVFIILGAFIQTMLYVMIAPGVVGVLRWLKARLKGQRGARIYQPYLDIIKYFRRSSIIPATSSWIFIAAPYVVFGCYVVLGVLMPIFILPAEPEVVLNSTSWESFFGWPVADLLILIYVLGLAHFVLGLAGMDTGSPFGDLGSSREMFFHFLVMPVFILLTCALALRAHTTSLPAILRHHQGLGLTLLFDPALWLIIIALALVTLIETGRIPFDNPSTHLELTMVGKAINLEYSGHHLALLEWAEAMRLTFFLTLILNLLIPNSMASPGYPLYLNLILAAVYPIKLFIFLCLLAFWEMTRAKLRLGAVSGPATLALILSILAIVLVILS